MKPNSRLKEPDSTPAVEMRDIVKRFPGVVALDGVDFTVRRGEIHALLGENGAGKSTLMAVLAGRLVPEQGQVRLLGRRLPPGSPRAALQAGVGMVYQHFKLAPALTVAENLMLGRDRGRLRLGLGEISRRIEELGKRFDLPVDPSAKLWQLSLGEWQRAEIIRLLLWEARVLVLDEPTTILTALETEKLFAALQQLRDQGRSVIFISHKLDEVMQLADRVTVLARGRRKATLEAADTDKRSLARLMMDSSLNLAPRTSTAVDTSLPSRPVLVLEGLQVRDERGQIRLDDVSLELSPGEIVGVAGVAGNGQRELAEVCCGLRVPERGVVKVGGRDLTGQGPEGFIAAGVGFVPEDRQTAGAVPEFSLVENLMLKDYQAERFRQGIWIDWAKARHEARRLIKEYDIRPPDPDASAGALSGGNLQKLLLARELSRKPALIVAAYPLRGLDMASAGFVQAALQRYRDQGGSVLFIGEDLDALLEVADRLVVLFRGKVMGRFLNRGLSSEQLGLLMAGEQAA